MENKVCPKCGAKWLMGQHYWSTGAMGNEEDLAGLVCNKLSDDTCINPKKGDETGETWDNRLSFIQNWKPEDENPTVV